MTARPDYLRLHEAANAPDRLAAVRATGLLDTPVEAAFDRFTALAHRLLGSPVCLLTLVDAERDFVKSAVGLPEPLAAARQVPTGLGSPSFCQYMVAGGEPLAVDDARGHALFGDFPSVRDLGASACAGAPLRGPDGHRLGTLCVVEFAPRVWTENDRAVLLALADAASTEIALRLEAARAQAALAHQATHDALTGLANRALFRERMGRALARRAAGRAADAGAGDQVAVLFLDLDGFKAVNDTLGHAAGDQLVRGVATRLLGATRGFDTVARLGGDEFGVLLEGLTSPADAEVVVQRIVRALAAPVPVDDVVDQPAPARAARVVVTSASVGVAHAHAGSTVESLLRDADVAMYRAKGAGKGQYAVFDPAFEAAHRARQELEAELRQVLAGVDAADDAAGASDAADPACGRLALVFQPVVSLSDGAPTSVEALVRWHHPRRGTIPPAAFIPMAEETGLVGPLGRWVVREACRQLAAWEAALPPAQVPAVAVNVSGRQLEDPDLVANVARALRGSGVEPGRLTLEITETALARDPEASRDVLVALRALGVRLAIDDFGTGYSSLSYLQHFPVDVLKIDKRFIDGVAGGGSEAALARTIIALADSLGLRTVAEGVEQDRQHEALRGLGCELAQGYLFARPMPADDLVAWLAQRSAEALAPAAAATIAGV
jgi:diguanylate cyclase (GGDEF)-like protein